MDRKYKVGGYVKLAKLWERAKDAAVAYHSSYYAEKFRDDADKISIITMLVFYHCYEGINFSEIYLRGCY